MKLKIERIELEMAHKSLSQGRLAEFYGAAQPVVCRLLARIRAGEDVKPDKARKLADALGIHIEDLLVASEPDGSLAR